jgi:tRNA(Ile)-lysidine synthase
MSQTSTLISKLVADWPPVDWCDVTVLLAASGGADSVALVQALHRLRAGGVGRLILSHFNHGLRGAESDGDQAFVEELGRELGVRVVVGRRDGVTERGREGERSEESLRELRYEFLARMANETGARFVVTAHTADDHVETVLHNILRGTGLAGLAGIPRTRPLTGAATLIRPLLSVTRAEVLEYLAALGQGYRVDSSNASVEYTRNRIRRELLPYLESNFNPQVREALARLSQIAGAANEWMEHEAELALGATARRIKGGIELDAHALASQPAFLAQLVLRALWRQQDWPLQDMSHEKWAQLLAFAAASDDGQPLSRRDFPGNIRAEKQGGILRLTRPVESGVR